MKQAHVIDTQPVNQQTQPEQPKPEAQTTALATVERGGALGRAMTIDELHKQLEYIREVMRKEMKKDQDYGVIPGTGTKPTLLQPGAQKLLMTFNLTEQVKREALREYPGFHREYEFTITVKAPNGKEWDGVGTCSTLESKYRYRKAERVCPLCHKNAIIKGKAEYGGGWICFDKKGGCKTKFDDTDKRITSQPAGEVENDNPADQWNTVRKMAFKRGLVAAAINATNTSELWTQDLEEMAQNAEIQKARQKAPAAPQTSQAASAPSSPARAPAAPAQPRPSPTAPPIRAASDKTRVWMISKIPDSQKQLSLQFLIDIGWLMPNEHLEDLPLRYVPVTGRQLDSLLNCIGNFGASGDAVKPYEMNPEPEAGKAPAKPKQAAAPPAPAKTGELKPPPSVEAAKAKDPEWFFDVICPVPPRGVKKAEYDKQPDTIRDMYTRAKEGDDESRRRLFGFVSHFEAKPWVGRDGQQRPPGQKDVLFREALDAFADREEKQIHRLATGPAPQPATAEPPTEAAYAEEEERTPFD
jgi:hypothetical protein